MKIQKDKVVQFKYQLFETDKDQKLGELVEESDAKIPMVYLHGHNNLLAALENAMDGHEVNDKFSVALDAKDAYGEIKPNLEQRVPMKHLQGATKKWKKGMLGVVETEKGRRQVTVVKVGKFMVTVDFNHPFAGKDLTFDVEVLDIREATLEELAHGHVHAEGGHCH